MNDAQLIQEVARGVPPERYDAPRYDYRDKVAIVTGASQRIGRRTDPAKGETRERRGYGRIVNIGSAAAFIGFPRAGIYIASKHAAHGLSQIAALEIAADTDIRVNLLVPGSVKTHNYELFTEGRDEFKTLLIQAHPTKQILLPEDCVPALMFLCSDGAFFSVGQPFFIDGGFTAQ